MRDEVAPARPGVSDSVNEVCHVCAHVRKEKMYAALRIGVLCVSGNDTAGKRASDEYRSIRLDSAPIPEPAC